MIIRPSEFLPLGLKSRTGDKCTRTLARLALQTLSGRQFHPSYYAWHDYAAIRTPNIAISYDLPRLVYRHRRFIAYCSMDYEAVECVWVVSHYKVSAMTTHRASASSNLATYATHS
jgi:hypothetical protein